MPQAELDEFESFSRVKLPAAMRAFYARFDGMPDCECDGLIFGFSEFSKLYNVLVLALLARGSPDFTGIDLVLPNAAKTFVFADMMIGSNYYAVRLSPDPAAPAPVVEIGPDPSWRPHSPSFAEFLRLYAEEPDRLLFHGP